MNARDKRFKAFVENHRFWGAHTDFNPDLLWEVISQRGLPQEIQADFEVAELRHKMAVSAQNAINGRKGAKIAGRGRAKKKKKGV